MTDDPRPHNARVWNYWLGGTDNYPADRQAGDRVAGMFPGIVEVARANRAFLGRVVRYLAITHPTLELGGEENARAMRFWNENATPPITARTGAEIAGLLGGLRLLDPGLVPCSRRGPDRTGPGEPAEVPQYGAVARKD